MKTKTFSRLALAFLFAILWSAVARAETTALVNYQGKLKRSGTNVNGAVSVNFKIFTGETNDVCVYEESQQVVVVDGLYATLIGKNPTLGNIEDSAKLDDAFLEVTINGTKLIPRERFCPPAFAKNSQERWNLFSLGLFNPSGYQQFGFSAAGFGYPIHTINASNCNPSVAMAVFPMPAKAVQITSAKALITSNDNSVGWLSPELSPRLFMRLTARTSANPARRIGPDVVFTPTNSPPLDSWFVLPLSTNQTDLSLQPSESLCVEFGGYFPDQPSQSCNVWSSPYHRYLLLDIRVK